MCGISSVITAEHCRQFIMLW